MLKDIAKHLLRAGVDSLPWGGKRAVLAALVDHYKPPMLLSMLAKQAQISVIGADGAFGRVTSSSSDEVVLHHYAQRGQYGIASMTFFRDFFGEDGGSYLDIGANIGLTTLPLAVDDRIACYCFEPDPVNFSHLSENLRRNAPGGNIHLQQLALYSHQAVLQFGIAGGNIGDHRIWSGKPGRHTIDVAADALDAVIDLAPGKVAAKIDVQGAEPLLIAGGSRTLARVGALVVEFSPSHMRQMGADRQLLLDYLGGFARLATVPEEQDDAPVFRPAAQVVAELEQFARRSVDDESQYCNVYALRDAG